MAIIVLAVGCIWAIVHEFSVGFGAHTDVSAEIGSVGDSLKRGDIVTYRDVIVGHVANFEPTSTGGALVELRLDTQASRIPSDVTAYAAPADLFGASEIVLAPGNAPSPKRLSSGQTIPANTANSVAGLQTALSDAYDLVTAVRPAELNAALAALGEAITGRGTDLQRLVRDANSTLRVLAPDVPQLTATIESLTVVTDELAADTPELLDAVGDLLKPAQVIVDQRKTVTALFQVVPPTADRATRIIDQTHDDIVTTVVTQQDFLAALTTDPNRVGRNLKNGGRVAEALNDIAAGGRLHAHAYATGISLAGFVQSLLGKPSAVLDSTSDPRLYSSKDCATYGGSKVKGCVDAPPANATDTAQDPAGAMTTSGEASENEMIAELADVLADLGDGGEPSGITTLLGALFGGSSR